MRVLCAVTGSPSHARASLPFVRALSAAGHEVMVAVPSGLTSAFAGERVIISAVLPDLMPHLVDGLRRLVRQLPAPPDFSALDPARLGGLLTDCPYPADAYHALLPVALAFGPDVVLRDGFELGSMLVAEAVGVPHLTVPSGAANVLGPGSLAGLDAHRDGVGLPRLDDPHATYRHGRIDCIPARFSFAHYDLDPVYTYRQPPTVRRDEVLPDWAVALPAERPLIVAAIGTALPLMADRIPGPLPVSDPAAVLRAIVTALSDLDCAAVVATAGLSLDGAPRAEHVHLTERIPQPLLLQCADLFVTHAGYNSIREAVVAGVPMAALPQFGDQPSNADRITALGLGARIAEPTAEQIADTCTRLLGDPAVAAQVRSAQRHMLALPGVDTVVSDLQVLTHSS